jgi:hypothetical protein
MDFDDINLKKIFFVCMWFGIILVSGISIIWGLCAASKNYTIWSERKRGEAEYAHAESNRQITTLEAVAKKESSKALADAEVIRAEGVARANKIIGDSLKNNESYLRYLWIQGLQTNQMQTIYIPTEAGLPILEAGRVPVEQRRGLNENNN